MVHHLTVKVNVFNFNWGKVVNDQNREIQTLNSYKHYYMSLLAKDCSLLPYQLGSGEEMSVLSLMASEDETIHCVII